jgi:hypothetical protein
MTCPFRIFGLQKSISCQFCTLFLLWLRIEYLPTPKTYRRSYHLPDDFGFLGMFKTPNLNGR